MAREVRPPGERRASKIALFGTTRQSLPQNEKHECQAGGACAKCGVGSLGGMLKGQSAGELEEVCPSILADLRFHKIWAGWVKPGIIERVVTAGRKLPVS